MSDITLVPDVAEGDQTFVCESDLSAKQYHFVKMDTSEKVVICGANDKTIGVLQNKPNGSASAPALAVVRMWGLTKLKISETVAMGKFLTPTADGDAEVCDAANEEFGAKSITSGEDNDLIAALLCSGEVTASDA